MSLGKNMNVVAILRSGEAGEALSQACTGMNGTKVNVHVGKLKDVKPGVDILRNPDVLLLDVNPRDADEVAQLQTILQSHFPTVPVVATAVEVTLQDIRQLMRLGVVDFIPQPFTRDDLAGALDHAATMRQSKGDSGEKRGNIITFLKAGGGVGATTLAVQSGCLLASRNKGKGAGADVCLLDLDLQFGTAALYLDLDNRVGMADVIQSYGRLDRELMRNVMSKHDSGLDLLAAPRDMVAVDSIAPEHLDECLKIITAEYETTILDLPEVWTPWTYRAIQNSDTIILVTQLTVAGIRQAKRQLDTLISHGVEPSLVKVALNRFEKGWGKSVHLKEAEDALGRKFDFFIINDYQTVSEALNQGVSLSEIKKKSKVEISIQKMIDESIKSITGEEERSEPRLLTGLRK